MEVFYGDFRRGFYVSESKKKAEVLLEPVKGAKKRLAAVRKKK